MKARHIMGMVDSSVRYVRVTLKTYSATGQSRAKVSDQFAIEYWPSYSSHNHNLLEIANLVSIGVEDDILCLVISFD